MTLARYLLNCKVTNVEFHGAENCVIVCVCVFVIYVDEVMIPLMLIVCFQLSGKRPHGLGVREILLNMSQWVMAVAKVSWLIEIITWHHQRHD